MTASELVALFPIGSPVEYRCPKDGHANTCRHDGRRGVVVRVVKRDRTVTIKWDRPLSKMAYDQDYRALASNVVPVCPTKKTEIRP